MNEAEPKKRTHRQSRAGRGHDKKKDAKQKLLPGFSLITRVWLRIVTEHNYIICRVDSTLQISYICCVQNLNRTRVIQPFRR